MAQNGVRVRSVKVEVRLLQLAHLVGGDHELAREDEQLDFTFGGSGKIRGADLVNVAQPRVLLEARLYPDQYALVRQNRSACDSAKLTSARLTGQEPPKHPDVEKTIDELRTRVHVGIEGLGGSRERRLRRATFRPG